MNPKTRLYLILILTSIAIRIFFYIFPFEAIFHKPIALTFFLHDGIFYIVLIKLLRSLNDRKWIIIVTWIMLLSSFAYDTLACIMKKPSFLTAQQFERWEFITGATFFVFYICIFFTRKGPARIFFRGMTAAAYLPYLYAIFTIILHLPNPDPWINSHGFVTILSILLNLLLLFAVLRARRGRQDEYADFLTD